MRSLHIFHGGAGGLLADLILGHEPVCAVDNDAQRCDHLRVRASEGWFPRLEVVCADVATWDASPWKGRVDLVHAGIPCPRWSSARRGRGNPPDHWPNVRRIINEVRPRYIFLECVAAYKRDHQRTADELEYDGWKLSPPLITSATGLGAPFARDRYWALGRPHGDSQPGLSEYAEVAVMSSSDAGVWWEADPRVLRVDDGMANWVDRFSAIGDGQVPLQAAAAFLQLLQAG